MRSFTTFVFLTLAAAAGAQTLDKKALTLEGAADAVEATTAAAPGAVRYFDKARVEDAFARGDVLLDGAGRNYMVHASRREQAGQAEIHTRDTDVIHVLSGSATFVTGGTIVDGTAVEPDEIRGAAVEGGETRTISAGDVVVVPAGTPHWFKAVPAPMTYYVVKVR
jgi:quercetin dioxygenase-like cupin family protein